MRVAHEAIGEHDGRVVCECADAQLVRVHVGCNESCKIKLAKRGTDRGDTSLQRLADRAESFTRDKRQKRAVEVFNINLNRTLAQASDNHAVDLQLFNRNASE